MGDYEILGVAGRGGMGVVFKARQKRLNRVVALKMIAGGSFSDAKQHRRFATEVEACAQLHHPNIVAVYEAGEHEGLPFFSMEWVEGQTLAELVSDQPIESRRAATFLITIARAIQHAHDSGVAHRDLKPSNILIDEDDHLRVTDFGLARHLGRESELTVSGQTLGTPGYLPPEHIAGSPDQHGPSGDIYALGAILYYLLTGRAPFVGESIQTALLQVLEAEPVSPRKLNPDVSLDLETTCLRCLEKAPSRRYSSAGELADELQRFLAGKPILARPIGAGERTLRWMRRNPLVATISTLLVASVMLGLAATTWQWRHARRNATHLAATVVRLKMDQAEGHLAGGKTGEALALLAGLVREDPNHRVAAQRIVSVLRQRSFCRPMPWLAADQQFRWASAFALHDHLLMTSTNEGRTLTLWDLTKEPQLLRVIETSEAVRLSAFSRDGRLSLVATEDGELFLYDLKDGSLRAGPCALDGFAEQLVLSPDASLALVVTVPDFQSDNHNRARGVVLELASGKRIHEKISFHWAAFSPDVRRLVTIHRRVATVRDASTWNPVGESIHESSRINMAAFSPDSKQLITAAASAKARIWDVESGRPFAALEHPVNVQAAYFSPDGEIVFTLDNASRGRLWDLTTQVMNGQPFSQTKGIGPDSFSRVGDRFLSYGGRGLIVRNTRNGEPVSEPINSEGALTRARFLRDGHRFVTTSFGHEARLWEVPATAFAPTVFRDEAEVEHAALSPDGTKLATGMKKSWARIWDVSRARPAGDWLKHNAGVLSVQWSPDSRFVVTASRDHTARIWDAASAKLRGEALRHSGPVQQAEFSPDGLWVATASEDHTARLWEAATGQPMSPPLRHEGRVQNVRFSPDGRSIATASRDKTVRFWSVPAGQPMGEPIRDEHHFKQLDFSRDGRRLATGGEDRFAQVWDLESRSLTFPAIQHAGVVNSIRFDPAATRVVTAAGDGTARIWSAFNGRALSRPMQHQAGVLRADFSPDGQLVLTVSIDQTARVWDAATGHPITDPLPHDGRVIAGQWAGDGRSVMTASYDHTARLWPLFLVPQGSAPDWLPDLAEASGGFRLAGDDTFERLNARDVAKIHERVRALRRSESWSALLSGDVSEAADQFPDLTR